VRRKNPRWDEEEEDDAAEEDTDERIRVFYPRCNDPKIKSSILELLVIFFFASL
jgi:hypothetical protein